MALHTTTRWAMPKQPDLEQVQPVVLGGLISQKNETTTLHIHPFMYMDGTLLEYLKLSPENAILAIKKLHEQVQHFGGTFSFLWHNETISGYQHWADYQEVFKATLRLGS